MGGTVIVGREPQPAPGSVTPGELGENVELSGWRRLLSTRALAFTAVYVIWGSTYLGIRVGVETIPPLLLAGARFVIAGAVLFGFLLARGARLPNRREWWRASVAGIVMLAGGSGLVTLAETRVPSNLAALLLAGVPAYVLLLDWWRPSGVRPSRQALLGILLGTIGLLLLVRPGADDLAPSHWYAVALLVLAGWCWASGSLYSRYRPQHPSSMLAGAQQMIAGGLVLSCIALGHGDLGQLMNARVSGASVAAFVYLTVFGSLVAFSAFNWLVTKTTPAQLSTTAYVNPVVALVLGWLVLGESLHPVSLGGAALIVVAVIIMLGRFGSPKARRRHAAVHRELTNGHGRPS
jgi:drug/metabolite transporter (DMT)-like permease